MPKNSGKCNNKNVKLLNSAGHRPRVQLVLHKLRCYTLSEIEIQRVGQLITTQSWLYLQVHHTIPSFEKRWQLNKCELTIPTHHWILTHLLGGIHSYDAIKSSYICRRPPPGYTPPKEAVFG